MLSHLLVIDRVDQLTHLEQFLSSTSSCCGRYTWELVKVYEYAAECCERQRSLQACHNSGGAGRGSGGALVLTGALASGYRECGLNAGTADGLFALLAHLSPTEPTHLLSNIYKCHGVEADALSIFSEGHGYRKPFGILTSSQVIVATERICFIL